MAAVEYVEPVVRICAVISRYPSARDWAITALQQAWGKIAHQTPPLPFPAGGFYEAEMGTELVKTLVAFEDLCDPTGLADWKLQSNCWEQQYGQASNHPEARPLNLDPGYVTQAKLILATTKDRDHRVYLRDGIFAEVTINYVGKQWVHHRWTYPDYRTAEVARFAGQCREQIRHHVRLTKQSRQRDKRDGSRS